MTWGVPIEADLALSLPVEQLGLHLLRGFQRGGEQQRHNFLNSASQTYPKNGYSAEETRQITRALAEAYDWLILQGLLSGIPGKDSWLFITRKGERVLDTEGDELALLRAESRLDVDLHPLIAQRVRAQFLLGEYEMAAMVALREVEIRVRQMSGGAAGDIGVALMKKAFNESGALRDPVSEKGEQEAMMALFWGAIGVFKNPVSHRQVDYDDPTLASEVILLADLLLRLLDSRAPAQATT
jgi:uncharacterized protein (TIGR02391 family)